jgi:hypothetical protein
VYRDCGDSGPIVLWLSKTGQLHWIESE